MTKRKGIVIIHVLANGKELDSMEGYEVPLNKRTRRAYEVLSGKDEEGKK